MLRLRCFWMSFSDNVCGLRHGAKQTGRFTGAKRPTVAWRRGWDRRGEPSKKVEQSRKNMFSSSWSDLSWMILDVYTQPQHQQAIAHMLIYFLRGTLPWSGLQAKTQAGGWLRCAKKRKTTLAAYFFQKRISWVFDRVPFGGPSKTFFFNGASSGHLNTTVWPAGREVQEDKRSQGGSAWGQSVFKIFQPLTLWPEKPSIAWRVKGSKSEIDMVTSVKNTRPYLIPALIHHPLCPKLEYGLNCRNLSALWRFSFFLPLLGPH